MQNVVYFLQQKECLTSEFSFSLTPNGMYSPGLLSCLFGLDKKQTEVVAFQETKAMVEDFPLKDWKHINALVDLYELDIIFEHKKNSWIIALASLLYVKTSLLPGCDEDVAVNRVLQDVTAIDEKTARKAFYYLEGGRGIHDGY